MKKKHGLDGTKICRTWRGMLSRCYSSFNKDYHRYGMRGIKVCEFLRASPAHIVSLIGDKPLGFTIDRKDNDSGYTCGACAECLTNGWAMNIQWATRLQQVRNRSNTIHITVNGVTKSTKEWALITGLPMWTIHQRHKSGWADEECLSPKKSRALVTIEGVTKTLNEWSEISKLDIRTLESRFRRGVTGSQLIAPLQRAARRKPALLHIKPENLNL